MSVQCIRLLGFSFFGIEIAIGIEIDAVGRLILSNLGASSAETAEHRGHPVEFIGPYLFDPDSDPDFDLDYPNLGGRKHFLSCDN